MDDKWGRRLFKTGALVLLLIGAVHSLSFLGRPTPANDTEKQLLELMRGYKFLMMGSLRSMDNLLRGFSIAFMLGTFGMGFLDIVVLRERANLLKNVALVNALWLGAMVAVSLRYFFAAPTVFLVVAFLIFAAAWLSLRKSAS
jgi:hypothetical protein